jgi:hypothetical protein
MDDNNKDEMWTNTKNEFWVGVRIAQLFVYQILINIVMLPYHIIMNTPLPGDPPKEEMPPSTSKYFIVRMLSSILSGVIEGLGYAFRAFYLAVLIYVILTAVTQHNYHMSAEEFVHHLLYTTKGDSL